MKNQTVVYIVVTGILLGLWGIFYTINSVSSEIVNTRKEIDSLIDVTDRRWGQFEDSMAIANDTTGLGFIEATRDTNSGYIPEADSSPANIWLESGSK